MPHVHRAAWVLPIVAPPIRDGWVAVEDGRIVAVGGPESRTVPRSTLSGSSTRAPGPRPPAPRIAILPGLVNAHTHLELSWMRGRVPPGDAMPAWAERLIGLRREAEEQLRSARPLDGLGVALSSAEGRGAKSAFAKATARSRRSSKGVGGSPSVSEPIIEAIRESRASGTVLVGDVTNTLAAYEPLAKSALSAAVFFELIGFRPTDPAAMVADAEGRLAALPPAGRLRSVVVPHAPYSVSPDLFRAIGRAAGDRPLSVHLGESPEEIRFLRNGTGPWRDVLERIGAWSADWVAPACGPVEYLERLGLINNHLVAVHAAQLTDAELGRLASVGATVVTCPRSNRWTGAGTPPVERFYASGVRVAIGTDSLASVADLNLFNEMAAVRRIASAISARQILRSATLDSARALGFGAELGSITQGKRADLLAVRIPPDVEDVEEYLVNGVQPSEITWLDAD